MGEILSLLILLPVRAGHSTPAHAMLTPRPERPVRAAVSEELSPGRPTWITGDFRTSGLLGLIRTSSSFRFFCAVVAVATNLSAYVTVLAALL